jgi:hypothetical protein
MRYPTTTHASTRIIIIKTFSSVLKILDRSSIMLFSNGDEVYTQDQEKNITQGVIFSI